MSANEIDLVYNELRILERLRNSNVIRLLHEIDTQLDIFLIFELIKPGCFGEVSNLWGLYVTRKHCLSECRKRVLFCTEFYSALNSILHWILFCTELYSTLSSILYLVLFCTEFYSSLSSILHWVLFCADFYSALSYILHWVLFCTEFYSALSSILHWVLFCIEFYSALSSILHWVLCYFVFPVKERESGSMAYCVFHYFVLYVGSSMFDTYF